MGGLGRYLAHNKGKLPSVLNVEVRRDFKDKKEIKNKSYRRSNFSHKKPLEWSERSLEGGRGAITVAGRTEVGEWVIGPGKHEGRGTEEVIVQRKLNIHIYFTLWQFIGGSEIEMGPIQDIKTGVTEARKGGLIRMHAQVQSQSDPCKGGRIGTAGLPVVFEDTRPHSQATGRHGTCGPFRGIAMTHWIYDVWAQGSILVTDLNIGTGILFLVYLQSWQIKLITISLGFSPVGTVR